MVRISSINSLKEISMYNIYDLLLKSPSDSNFYYDVHSFIIKSLTTCFNKSLSRQETADDLSFSYVDYRIRHTYHFTYSFKYGSVTVNRSENQVYIHFELSESASKILKIIFEIKSFVVYVDHFMAYSRANFNKDFHLRSNMKAFAQLKFSHIVFDKHTSNELLTSLFYGDIGIGIFRSNSNQYELSERYFSMDSKFSHYLSKFLLLCEFDSHTFKVAFPEYDSIIASSIHHIDIVMLLNMFEKEYSENFEDIEDRLSIANMISI